MRCPFLFFSSFLYSVLMQLKGIFKNIPRNIYFLYAKAYTQERVKTFIKKRLLKIHIAVSTSDLCVSKSHSPGIDLFIDHLRTMFEYKCQQHRAAGLPSILDVCLSGGEPGWHLHCLSFYTAGFTYTKASNALKMKIKKSPSCLTLFIMKRVNISFGEARYRAT